jgi:hypothetical protein
MRSSLPTQPELKLAGCYIGRRLCGQQENLLRGKYFSRHWRKDCGRTQSKLNAQSSKESSS